MIRNGWTTWSGIRIYRLNGTPVFLQFQTCSGQALPPRVKRLLCAHLLLVCALANRFPGLTLIEMASAVFGRWAGMGLGLFYTFWATFTNAIILREFADFVISVVLPTLRRDSNLRGTLLVGGAATLAVIGGLLGTVVLGTEATKSTFPLLDLARMISIAEFLERVDPLVVAIWVGGILIKLGVFAYAGATALTRTVRMNSPASVAFPLMAFSVTWAMSEWTGLIDLTTFIKFLSFPWEGLMGLAVPFLIWVGALITGASSRGGDPALGTKP